MYASWFTFEGLCGEIPVLVANENLVTTLEMRCAGAAAGAGVKLFSFFVPFGSIVFRLVLDCLTPVAGGTSELDLVFGCTVKSEGFLALVSLPLDTLIDRFPFVPAA